MKIVNIEVGGDLYQAGRTEDGVPYIAENYFVTVEFEGGEVYRHREVFLGCKVEEDDEGYSHFGDIREESSRRANTLCERVQAHVAAGGTLDMSHWSFYRTIYGSGAYLAETAEMTPRQLAGEED
jgi:hypothetical protein